MLKFHIQTNNNASTTNNNILMVAMMKNTWNNTIHTTMCGSTCTYVLRDNVQLVEVVQDGLVLPVVLPVAGQPAQEEVLAVRRALHHALWQVHHPLLQEVVRRVQGENKICGPREGRNDRKWDDRLRS